MSDRHPAEYRQLVRDLSAEMRGEYVLCDPCSHAAGGEVRHKPPVCSGDDVKPTRERMRLLVDQLCMSFLGQGANGLPGVRRLALEAAIVGLYNAYEDAARAGLDDRERLDWLEREEADLTHAWPADGGHLVQIHIVPDYETVAELPSVRAAIDAARGIETESSGQRAPSGGEND